MVLDEKIAMVHGVSGPYVGNSTNHSRLGIPGLHCKTVRPGWPTEWTTGYSTTNGAGGIEDLLVKSSGRYVRMNGVQSATGAGHSLQEFEVYSTEVQIFPELSIHPAATNTMILSWPMSWRVRNYCKTRG